MANIQDRIQAAVEWRHYYGSQGQTSFAAKNSAAVKTEIGSHELASNVIYVDASDAVDETIPHVLTWHAHGHKIVARLQHACEGPRTGWLRLTYRIEDWG